MRYKDLGEEEVGILRPADRILVVDDDAAFRTLVEELLSTAGHDVCVAGDAAEALRSAHERTPRLAILDVSLPGLSGYQLCLQLKEELPGIGVIFVSGTRKDSLDRVAGLLLGADDYLLKPFEPDELLARVRLVLRRPTPVHAAQGATAQNLTPRELEVLRRLAGGQGQSEIAEHLSISPKTVGAHIDHTLSKLGVHSRAQAVALAYRLDLVLVHA
jgi:DNA-binding NarL/FixJ family response regulator